MSECITRVERITKVEPHPNAERLEVAHVKGWHCVVPKGVYQDGSLCVYIPIDSVLPEALANFLFEGAKVKPPERIKTIRLRGLYSQGLVASVDNIKKYLRKDFKVEEGEDLTERLGITKYEPPLPSFQSFSGGKSTGKNPNANFKKYKGFENFKNYNGLFDAEESIIATEKIHGTNFRCGWVKKEIPTNFFKRLWFNVRMRCSRDYEWEWLVGSHNVQLDPGGSGNVYADTARTYDLKNKLKKGEELFGEIYGPSIQKGYHYGLQDGQFGLAVFDILKDDQWVQFDTMREQVERMGIEVPPVLFRGKFKDLNIDEMVLGDSIFRPAQKVREGLVLRTEQETFSPSVKGGRKMLKCISPEYLLRDNTDFH